MMDQAFAWLGQFFIAVGTLLHVLTAAALLKFPTFLTRLQASSKASTLGIGLNLLGVILLRPWDVASFKLLLVLLFAFFSSALIAHCFAKAYIFAKSQHSPDK